VPYSEQTKLELQETINEGFEMQQTVATEGFKKLKEICLEHVAELDNICCESNSLEINLSCNKKRLGILFVLELADEVISLGRDAQEELNSIQ
jgi:hypothetical protein